MHMEHYDHDAIEKKWRERWQQEKVHEPDLKNTRKPFYNLMMFPYPSAEGLHVGNMYAFTGADIYGRLKRMQGYDVFEPIGLDGFGIHSENYAMKTNQHPMELSKKSEANFYRQLRMLGNGFAWDEKLETYDPEYYQWTQWIFTEMFNRGLAYRKKAPVNWCPSCKTVLADEQVIAGKCERCDSVVEKRELAQWFFRITDYAERLLNDLEKIDWSEKVKTAQRNWIGKSEGALIDFELKTKANFVLLHGYKASPEHNFHPWLKKELESRGYTVQVPALPHPNDPDINEQVDYVLKNFVFDKHTVLVGHSLGTVVAMKVAEQLSRPLKRLVLVAGFITPKFKDHPRSFEYTFDWKFDFKKIKHSAGDVILLRDPNDSAVAPERAEELHQAIGGTLIDVVPQENHVCGKQEPEVLAHVFDGVKVFTTRPDTIFGATYVVIGPEHALLKNSQLPIFNFQEVQKYIEQALVKSPEERIAENREKTGIELKGITAINPATKKEIPVWVADYVLGDVGTGAIMAVPAHDERDYEFAKKFKLPIIKVILPKPLATRYTQANSLAAGEQTEIRPEADCWIGEGEVINSDAFNGMDSEEAKREIMEFVCGQKKVTYRLRDWLISRQRYWGPPIPLLFCESCKKRVESAKHRNIEISKFTQGELENPGWHAVPPDQLPVLLPYVKNFRPTGTGVSPLAADEGFKKTICPKCGSEARRETDVSDTFLDSAWYYYRYPSVGMKNSKVQIQKKSKNQDSLSETEIPWSAEVTKHWLPIDMYTGGAEHSVLHLLYTRFITKVFYDWGLIHFDEPFKKFRAHGLIIKDGAKMSKSKGNVVNPDEYIQEFGADALRMYLMFLGPFDRGGDFQERGILGAERFLKRALGLVGGVADGTNNKRVGASNAEQSDVLEAKVEKVLHQSIKKVTEDIENLKYNTAISQLMIFLNEMERAHSLRSTANIEVFLKLLNPFAPHTAQELWSQLGHATFIDKEPWPQYDEKLVAEEIFSLVIQVNGKTRDIVEAQKGISREEAEIRARASTCAQKHLQGKNIKKVIFVQDKLINFVIAG